MSTFSNENFTNLESKTYLNSSNSQFSSYDYVAQVDSHTVYRMQHPSQMPMNHPQASYYLTDQSTNSQEMSLRSDLKQHSFSNQIHQPLNLVQKSENSLLTDWHNKFDKELQQFLFIPYFHKAVILLTVIYLILLIIIPPIASFYCNSES